MAKTYYVSSSIGDDKNNGTESRPYKTISKAVSQLVAGDTLFLMEGIYRESVFRRDLNGTAESPIVITAYPNHKVTWSGAIPIQKKWTEHALNIYKTTIDEDIWQLFIDDEMMTSARWPNAEAWTSEVWDPEKKAWAHQADGSSYGNMIDDNTGLADTGKSFEGGMVILNVGSWLSFAEQVTSHQAGSESFTYSQNFKESQYHHKIHHGKYFMEASLSCLDTLKEWYYDKDTKQLYVYAKQSPQGKKIEGKNKSYALRVIGGSYVKVKDIDYFACTVSFDKVNHTSLESCHFMYPSYSKRMLKSIAKPEVTKMMGKNETTYSGNIIRNCKFEYADGSGLTLKGKGDLVENCFFHHIDYSAVGALNDVMLNAINTTDVQIRYTKLQWGGNSLGMKVGHAALVEYCEVSHIGYSQNDGSSIQASEKETKNTIFRYNWSHDCIKTALRFDSPFNDSMKWGEHGTMNHNVAWNSKPMVPKGNYHDIYNNTSFNNIDFDLSLFNDLTKGSDNSQTITRNNALGSISGSNAGKIKPYAGKTEYNWIGGEMSPVKKVVDELNDPENMDFRPKVGSELIDAGYNQEGFTDNYYGDAPDIGAYEFGDINYWKAGLRFDKASYPVPADKGTTKSSYVDLMWTEGYEAIVHHIYFSENESDVISADTNSSAFQVEVSNNIYTPNNLESGKTYYWRVDVVRGEEITKGDIWSFTAGKTANNQKYNLKVKVLGDYEGTIGGVASAKVRIDGEMKNVHEEYSTASKQVTAGIVRYEILLEDKVVGTYTTSIYNNKTEVQIIKLEDEALQTVLSNDIDTELFKIFPNPTADSVTVSRIPVGTEINIYNTAGEKLYKFNAIKEQTNYPINISSFSKGVYILDYQLRSGKSVTKKLIKI